MGNNGKKESLLRTWIWILFMLVIILGTGGYAFYVVSDKGMPTWDYRPVKDLPAESVYAEYEKLPFPQHIKGKGGE